MLVRGMICPEFLPQEGSETVISRSVSGAGVCCHGVDALCSRSAWPALPEVPQLAATAGEHHSGAKGPWHQVEQSWLAHLHGIQGNYRAAKSNEVPYEWGQKVAPAPGLRALEVVPAQVRDEETRQCNASNTQHAVLTKWVANREQAQKHRHPLSSNSSSGNGHNDALLEQERREEHLDVWQPHRPLPNTRSHCR